jgi:hypothetical protein
VDRRTNTALNAAVGFVVSWLVARLLSRTRPVRDAVVGAAAFAVVSWIGYERPAVLDDE